MNYFWPGSLNTHWGPGPVNTNWQPGSVNTNLGPGPVNTNLGPGPEPGAKQRAGGRKIQIPSPWYFFSSRDQEIKNITKMKQKVLFLFTFLASFLMAFLEQKLI